MRALSRANEIRSKRAKLKRDLKAGKVKVEVLLRDPPDYVLSAKAFDMIVAVPKYGRVKANKILTVCRISPSKTIGGLSARQRGELQLRRPQPLVDRLAGVRPTALEPLAERRRIWRGDEHLHGLRHRCAHLAGALHLDLQDDGAALGEPPLDLRAKGPVPVAAVGGVLEELAVSGAAVELLAAQEVVVAAVHFGFSRLPGRRRDRQLQAGHTP